MRKILAAIVSIVMSIGLVALATPAHASYGVYLETGPVKRAGLYNYNSRVLADPESNISIKTYKTTIGFQYRQTKMVKRPGIIPGYKRVYYWTWVPGSLTDPNNKIDYRAKNIKEGAATYAHIAVGSCPKNDVVYIRAIMHNTKYTTWQDPDTAVIVSHSTDYNGFRVDCRI